MDSLKNWFVEVGIKKFGPSAIRGGIGIVSAYMLAHAGAFEKLGIFYDQAAQTITVHLSALQDGLDVALLASIAGLIKVLNYHGGQVVDALKSAPPAPPTAPAQ